MILELLTAALSSAALVIYLMLYKKQIREQPFSIASIYLLTFFIFYFCDTAYTTLNYQSTFRLSNTSFEFNQHDLPSLWLYYVSAAGITLSIFSIKIGKLNTAIRSQYLKLSEANFLKVPLVMTFTAVMISLALLTKQISDYGFIAYFGNLAVRSTLFSETTMQNAFISMSISTYALCVALHHARLNSRFYTGALLIPVLTLALLTGARATIVEIAFIICFVRSFTKNDIRLDTKNLMLLVAVVAGLSYFAMQTRTHADSDITGPLDKIFRSEQIPQSENGLNILTERFRPTENTILKSFVSFIPRAPLEKAGINKGDGANAVYTAAFVPYRWHDQNSQISIGGLNEVLMNFGYAGLLYIAVTAMILRIILDCATRNRYAALCIPALTWSAFQFLRGDSYHTINKLFTFIAGIVVIYLVIKAISTLKRIQ